MLETQWRLFLNLRKELIEKKCCEMIIHLVRVLYFLKLFTVLLFRNPRNFPLVCSAGVNNDQHYG